MTTYYKINGTYVSWQEAYNSGYTQEPSNSISYKSASYATWGDSAGTGMLLGDTTDPIAALFFLEGESGWHSMDEMVSDFSVYPSDAEDVQMHNTNTGTNSDGVKLESDGVYYYLIANALNLGWVAEDDLSDYGWEEKGAVTLPTVTKQQMGYVPWGSPGVTFLNGQSRALYYNGSTVSYNNNVLYSVRANSTNSQTEPDYYYNHAFTVISFNGTIGIFNGSGGDIYTEGCYLYTCDSNSSSLVTVYNANNAEYYAFKYTVDGTDYYYVLDGTQDDWTDDLSSIGYHLPLPLPTVEFFADSNGGWCCTSSFPNTTNISSNYIVELYNRDGGGTVTGRSACDTSKKYSLIQWQAVNMVLEGRTEIEIESDTGYLRAKNVSNSAITFLQARIVVCSSSDATVEMVLDADNNRYNAFKYTLNGTDYYYVLDGTQTDWTSDLSSTGYHLRSNFVFALKWRDGNWVSVNFDYVSSDNYWYAGILSSENASLLDSLGFTRTTGTDYGNYGYLNSKSRAKFEVLEVYEDLGQNPVSGYDLSTLEFRMNTTVLTLWNTVRNATNLKSYLCRVTPQEPLVVLLCVRWDSNRWIAPDFVANDWFYTGIRSSDDKASIQAFGLSTTTAAPNAGTIGNIIYNSNYNYEILALYSDIGQTVSSYTNLSNLSMGPTTHYSSGVTLLTINNVTAINSGLIMSYKLRITRKQS